MNVVSAAVLVYWDVSLWLVAKAAECVNWSCQNCASEFPFHGLDNDEFISTVDDETLYVKNKLPVFFH